MKNQIAFSILIIIVLTALSTGLGNASSQAFIALQSSGVIQQNSTSNPGPYSYIINISGSNYQMTDGTTGQIDYQSTNAAQVANDAVGNLTQGGGSILFNSGTYNLTGSITTTNEDNVTLVFEKGATLFVSNGMNLNAISLANCNNWVIQNATINGNAENQENGAGPGGLPMPLSGVGITGGANNKVDGANITDCGKYGVVIWGGTGYVATNNGIVNSLITYCGWNGVGINSDFTANSCINNYAENNEVAHCADVGISTYATFTTIENNYVHDMSGNLGYDNGHWGIAVEGGGNNVIMQNNVQNCAIGIQDSGFSNCTILNNAVSNCSAQGIQLITGCSYNTVEDNNVSLIGVGAGAYSGDNGICLGGATYNEITGNNVSKCSADGVWLASSANNNTISLNYVFDNGYNSASNGGSGIEIGGNNNYVSQNQVYDDRSGSSVTQISGIQMDPGAQNNVLIGNTVYNNLYSQIYDTNVPENTMINNVGYNPVGNIAKSIAGSTAFLVDSGSNSTWVSGKVYTNTGSAKVLIISGGAVSAVAENGVTLFTATGCDVTLQAGDTFSLTFSSTPTIIVTGQ